MASIVTRGGDHLLLPQMATSPHLLVLGFLLMSLPITIV